MSCIEGGLSFKVVFHRKSSSINDPFPLKVVLHERLPLFEGHLQSKVISHGRSSSKEGHLLKRSSSIKEYFQLKFPSKFLHWRLSSIKGYQTSKMVFHQRLSLIKGRVSSKIIFHQRLSSIKWYFPSGRLPWSVIFRWWSISIKRCLLLKVVFH